MKHLDQLTHKKPLMMALLIGVVGINMSWLNFSHPDGSSTLASTAGSVEFDDAQVDLEDLALSTTESGTSSDLFADGEKAVFKRRFKVGEDESERFDFRILYIKVGDKHHFAVEPEIDGQYRTDLRKKMQPIADDQLKRIMGLDQDKEAKVTEELAVRLGVQIINHNNGEFAAKVLEIKKAQKEREEKREKALEQIAKKKEDLDKEIENCRLADYEIELDLDRKRSPYFKLTKEPLRGKAKMECQVERLSGMFPDDPGYEFVFAEVNRALPEYLFSGDREFAQDEMLPTLQLSRPDDMMYQRDLHHLQSAVNYINNSYNEITQTRDPQRREHLKLMMQYSRMNFQNHFNHTPWFSYIDRMAQMSVENPQTFASRLRRGVDEFYTTPYQDATGGLIGGRDILEDCAINRQACMDYILSSSGRDRTPVRGGRLSAMAGQQPLTHYSGGGVPTQQGIRTPHTAQGFNRHMPQQYPQMNPHQFQGPMMAGGRGMGRRAPLPGQTPGFVPQHHQYQQPGVSGYAPRAPQRPYYSIGVGQ